MVDLAREAFNTNNYILASEIYSRTIRDSGPTLELYLGQADSLARAGKLREAAEAYINAFRLGTVTSEQLKHLATGMVTLFSKQEDFIPKARTRKFKDMFECGICKGIMNDPVTTPCGHSFCRNCLEREQSKKCRTCGVVHFYMVASALKTNIILHKTVEKWFPSQVQSTKLKMEGNKLFEERKVQEALELYSQACDLAPDDHLLMSNMSYAYWALGKFDQALTNADMTVKLKPDWPKGHYRKGMALLGLHRPEDAVLSFLLCLSLDPSIQSARTGLTKALHQILSPLPADQLKQMDFQQLAHSHSPSVLSSLLGGTAAAGGPLETWETALHLKEKLATEIVRQNKQAVEPDQLEMEVNSEELTSIEEGRPGSLSSPVSRSQSPVTIMKKVSSTSDLSRKRTHEAVASGNGSPVDNKQIRCTLNDYPMVNPQVVDKDDFECSLCFRLLYEPVTTPCGHVFCRGCLDRCLDHNNSCPLCKTSLVEYLAERRCSTTESILNILKVYFPEDFEERKRIHEEELEELIRMGKEKQEIPLFICTLAFPTVRCPLHIFEPRYRLMMRQCMESGTRQFGMCLDLEEKIGCILEIRDVQFFPDGRSCVDTIGGRRFTIQSRGMKDGYNTANVEYLSDVHYEGAELAEIQQLSDEVYDMASEWWTNLPGTPRSQISHHFGALGEKEPVTHWTPNGPAWVWWLVAVLPLEPKVQLTMLGLLSLKERLLSVKRVLNFFRRPSARLRRL
ncbi:LON peptidase N-terminal domain and RING finger protein 3 [Lingula anatina]|uniref:LON peptidase N-terminal domain and RING finger protein 3 n=1 Tax=Lingula anatina TaxID=7574 RepID=A0A1S3KH63_LINAN|nr:LON peptidase N-terminal domain and RING finger protein 3 [Lingula anatina]|eukprot:XP_013421842.1 LON peptidase N-terminal domain and RING finger protein 3 [Lingula anatina]